MRMRTSRGMETMRLTRPCPSRRSSRSDLDVRERLDLNYNGITNWVLYARGELAKGREPVGKWRAGAGQWNWRAAVRA